MSASTVAQAFPKNAFRSECLIRFRDCDPAQMVFYPRYFEMFNDLVEDWWSEGLHLSFSEMHAQRGWGFPTVHVKVDFVAPGRLGELLDAFLLVTRLGKSSIHLQIALVGPDGRERVRGKVVLVLIELKGSRPVEIPPDLRGRMAKYLDPASFSDKPNISKEIGGA
jgi:4-hydroxybenzoyl-CoA thioesterase